MLCLLTNNYRYGFNGKELDGDINNDDYDYGARIYDGRIGRWLALDPLQKKYPNMSPYNFCGDNPIIFKDPDGKDLVYFNAQGHEIKREISTTRFETYVQTSVNNTAAHGAFSMASFLASPNNVTTPIPLVGSFVKVEMPKIIQKKGSEATTSPEYQKYDYQIAASTYIFNQEKNAGTLKIYDDNNKALPADAIKLIPNRDPTDVKAQAIQESGAGVSTAMNEQQDILQVNNTLSNNKDWSDHLKNYGLSKGTIPNPEQSVNAALRETAYKGFRGGINPDPKTGVTNYTFSGKGWSGAENNYNTKIDSYGDNIGTMKKDATTPKKENYVK